MPCFRKVLVSELQRGSNWLSFLHGEGMHQALIAPVAVEMTVFLTNTPCLLGELWGEC